MINQGSTKTGLTVSLVQPQILKPRARTPLIRPRSGGNGFKPELDISGCTCTKKSHKLCLNECKYEILNNFL